jgi:hypothetical protein
MQKFLFIGEYWVKFPRSEYGGMWSVIASSEEECIEILKTLDEFNDEYHYNIEHEVKNAKVFNLEDGFDSCVVQFFFT